jgi:hypothetical protein
LVRRTLGRVEIAIELSKENTDAIEPCSKKQFFWFKYKGNLDTVKTSPSSSVKHQKGAGARQAKQDRAQSLTKEA